MIFKFRDLKPDGIRYALARGHYGLQGLHLCAVLGDQVREGDLIFVAFLINYSVYAGLRVVVAGAPVRDQLLLVRQGVRLGHQVASDHQAGLHLEGVVVGESPLLVGQGL